MSDAQFIAVVVALFAYLGLKLAKALGLLFIPSWLTDLAAVQGRRTGLSEHAAPFGQTERRAEQTLDRPPP